MTFNVPKVPRDKIAKEFKKHILNKVLFRIDFEDIFDAKEFASHIVSKVGTEYPKRQQEEENLIKLAEGLTTPIKKVISFILFNKDNSNSIKVSSTFLVLEYNHYKCYEDLVETFKIIFSLYNKLFPNNKILRLGLRKINFFDKPEKDTLQTFEGYFNSFLTTQLDSKLFRSGLNEDMNSLVVDEGDFIINYKYGTVKGKLDDNNARRFILDIDGFKVGEIAPGKLLNIANKINNKMFDIFYWSIGDKMKRELSK